MRARERIDAYFRTSKNGLSQRRRWALGRLAWWIGGLCFLISSAIIYIGSKLESREHEIAKEAAEKAAKNGASKDSLHERTNEYSDSSAYLQEQSSRVPKTERQFGASQIVKQNTGSSSEDHLPMGTTTGIVLVNAVVSSDANAPVIGQILSDVYFENALLIPQDSRVIGQGSLDDTTKRLQVRFHALIFPDGSQHSVSALALQNDGSSGLPGDYHGGSFAKQAGRFLGRFAGGLAEGSKDRVSDGIRPMEVGSLKNGVLNGLGQSAFDEANIQSEEMKSAHAYLVVRAGEKCLLYFEREFKP